MASKYWFAKNPDGRLLAGEADAVLNAINAGTEVTGDITVTGAAVGDTVLSVSFNSALEDKCFTTYHVSAADTVTWVMTNVHASAATANLGTVKAQAIVLPKAAVDSLIAGM